MKRLIATMLFSLSVVACEQQTLFAPHYTDYGGSWGVASKTSPQNSLRPVSHVNRLAPVNSSYAAAAPPRNDVFPGVNRSVPLAGTNSKGSIKNPGIWQDCNDYDGVTPCPGSGHGDMPFGVSAGDDDLNVEMIVIDDMPFLELDSPLVPWHGR